MTLWIEIASVMGTGLLTAMFLKKVYTNLTKDKPMLADTSIESYASTPSKTRLAQRVMILEKIKENGDATCSELEKLLGLCHQTASARISELHKFNKIVDGGERRFTQFGKKARVYKAVNER